MSLDMTMEDAPPASLPLLAVASVLLGFAALQAVAYLHAGVFEYPLDDVYIHLSVAEQIAAGGYGVNAGEMAAAASSPLYPLLLTPFAGTEAQRYLPLLWNTTALALCGWLWGAILVQAGYGQGRSRDYGLFAAIAVPLLVNMSGIAFTGMEHSLHMAASLAVVLGLLQLLDEDRLSPWLIVAIVLAPAFRFEAMALSLLAAGMLVLRGRWAAGLLAAAGAVAVIAAFMGTLVALGLDPLPSSVQAKLGNEVSETRRTVLMQKNSWPLLAMLLTLPLMRIVNPSLRSNPRGLLVPLLLLAVLAHLVAGRVGWMNRYEGYVLVASLAGLLALAAEGGKLARGLALIPVLVSSYVYLPHYFGTYPNATRSIDLQQAQMARFAKEFHAGPVAVNDLGWVAWQNPDYVLDIWGLGSIEALRLRRNGSEQRWAGRLAAERGVAFAMIYDPWFEATIGEDWVRLGELKIAGQFRYSAFGEVAFYATAPELAPGLRAKLEAWEAGLPEGASFVFEKDARQ